MTLTLDQREFDATARALITAKNQGVTEFLQQQGRLLARDLIAITPPEDASSLVTGKAATRGGKQKVEARIRKDVSRIYKPLRPLLTRLGRKKGKTAAWLRYYAGYSERPKADFHRKTGHPLRVPPNPAAIQNVLHELGYRSATIVIKPELKTYQQAFKDGRIQSGVPSLHVIDKPSLDEFLKGRLKMAGRTKAGWLAAARHFGLQKIAEWVARHDGQVNGTFKDNSRDTQSPFISLTNLAKLAGKLAPTGLIKKAMALRQIGMRGELKAIMRANAKKVARLQRMMNKS